MIGEATGWLSTAFEISSWLERDDDEDNLAVVKFESFLVLDTMSVGRG